MKAHWMIAKQKLKTGASLQRKALLAFLMAGCALLTQFFPTTASANGQTIAGAKQQAAAIANRLNQLGAQAAQMITKYNDAQTALTKVNQRIKSTQGQVSQTETKISQIRTELAKEAINDYMNGGNLNNLYVLLTENPTQTSVRQEFLNTVTNSQADLVASSKSALQDLHMEQASLQALQKEAATTLQQVTSAKNAAVLAVNQEKAQLNSVNATIAQLVAQRQAQLAEEAAARARAIAEARAAALARAAAASAVSHVGGGYANPLRAISALVPERIDQGVDYRGYGPIYAIGNGVILSTWNSGWPGGAFISYRLTSGPASGLVVYAAENIRPLVSIGQSVNSSTVIGTVYEGFDGIETGWADPYSLGETLARHFGQFSGANSTAFGFNFSQFLRALGAPGGVLQNSPPTGSLLPTWPHW